MSEPSARPGRSRKPLSQARIIAAAVQIADASGVAALTMRKVAERLGVEAMSLYHHVASKEAMLDGMVDQVFGEIALPEIGGPWQREMRQRAHSMRTVLGRHPWALGLMDSRRTPGLITLQHHDAVVGCLRQAGFSLAMTGHAYAVLDAFIYGFLVQELSMPFTSAERDAGVATQVLAAMPVAQLPHLLEFGRQHAMQPGYTFGAEFDYGLELVLDGLARAQARAES